MVRDEVSLNDVWTDDFDAPASRGFVRHEIPAVRLDIQRLGAELMRIISANESPLLLKISRTIGAMIGLATWVQIISV